MSIVREFLFLIRYSAQVQPSNLSSPIALCNNKKKLCDIFIITEGEEKFFVSFLQPHFKNFRPLRLVEFISSSSPSCSFLVEKEPAKGTGVEHFKVESLSVTMCSPFKKVRSGSSLIYSPLWHLLTQRELLVN